MKTAMLKKQRGITFGGFIIGAFILVLASITGLKLIPAYMQNAEIEKLFVTIANDPDMQKAAPSTLRASFTKRAGIDDIKAINAEDIEVASDGTKPLLSATYAVKIALVGNISLYLDFNPSSAAK